MSAGEFGSVMEGLLTQEESVLKVAVKTMKSKQTVKEGTMDPFTRTDSLQRP